MVAMRRVEVADCICCGAYQLAVEFEVAAGCQVSARVSSGQPVGGNSESLRQRLLDGELPARASGVRRDNIFCEVVAAEADASFGGERFGELRIEIIARAVRAIAERKIKVVADH